MESNSKDRQRTTQVVPLSEPSSLPNKESKPSKDERTLLSFAGLSLKKSKNSDEMNTNVSQWIEAIKNKVQGVNNAVQSKETFDILYGTLKTYLTDIVSTDKSSNILSNQIFRKQFDNLFSILQKLDLSTVYEKDAEYARSVFYRSFEMLTLPVMVNFLTGQCSEQMSPDITFSIRLINTHICSTVDYIVFKKNDLQNQIPTVRLLLEYVDRNKQNWNNPKIHDTLLSISTLLCTLVSDTIFVPSMIEASCADRALKWITLQDLPLDFQRITLHLLYNIARHDQGANVLNQAKCIDLLKDFNERVIKPNKDNNDELYSDIRFVYSMALSLLAEPKENEDDLNFLRRTLDRLMQVAIDCGQSPNNKCHGFHLSEPILVLTKLCVHDVILKYVLSESSVNNMKSKSRLQFFCDLLMKFRGALATDDDLDQLLLTALFNILWSISFHDEYVEELKSNPKFLITVKSLANDDGQAWVDQYVPKRMSSIPKAANGILWNIDEDNPARRATRAAPNSDECRTFQSDSVQTNKIRVMISYAHADKDLCQQLFTGLTKDKRLEIWVDFEYCHSDDLWEEIALAIERSNVILFLMSKDYQESKSCRQEVMYTKDSQKKRFIPIYAYKDFVATGWLGVRIVGPQYVRFGKKSVDETIKELIDLIVEDTSQQDSTKNKPKDPSSNTNKPIESTNNNSSNNVEVEETKPNKEFSKKPLEQWTKKDIREWFASIGVHKELADLYEFQHGTDILIYGQCLSPNWQIEYDAMNERYQQKYSKKLYRDQFVVLVGAINRLQSSKSKACVIS